MISQNIKQNAVYIGIAIIAWLIVYGAAPSYPFSPKGIILPMVKTKLVPSQKPVKVFTEAPYNASAIAYIHLEAHSLHPTKKQEQIMLAKAKAMTQKAGGDGLVIKAFAYEGPGQDNPKVLAKFVLFGKAIKLT